MDSLIQYIKQNPQTFAVIAAVISGAGAIIAALINRSKKESPIVNQKLSGGIASKNIQIGNISVGGDTKK